jgi:hypothetical protein
MSDPCHQSGILVMLRKIRLIESNAKSCYIKDFTCEGTLRQMFYLSQAPSEPERRLEGQ